jgi:hypothetical protein
LGFSNTYTEDPVDNNVLSVTIGVKWWVIIWEYQAECI